MRKRDMVLYAAYSCGFLWFLLPFVFFGILNIGNITGMAVFFGLAMFRIFYGRLQKTKIWPFLKYGMICVLCAVLGLSLFMVKAAFNAPGKNSTVIVLGCRVNGERESLMLEERLDAAYVYLEKNSGSYCILSGGKGSDEDISEAECMYRYMLKKGISNSRLYKEENSFSTMENLKNSADIIEKYGLDKKVAVVTNEFHQFRAQKIAALYGLEASAVSAKTNALLFPTFAVRELYAAASQITRELF